MPCTTACALLWCLLGLMKLFSSVNLPDGEVVFLSLSLLVSFVALFCCSVYVFFSVHARLNIISQSQFSEVALSFFFELLALSGLLLCVLSTLIHAIINLHYLFDQE